jgi:quercetin dioxygenase-like cupin family protein
MQSWSLQEIELADGTRSPVVLFSREEARAVLIGLEPGQELGEHQVKEAAFLLVVDGSAMINGGADGALDAGVGTLVAFEPNERRSVSSPSGARVLLFLAPWPGEGHYAAEERELQS